jgi:hypothetical protein
MKIRNSRNITSYNKNLKLLNLYSKQGHDPYSSNKIVEDELSHIHNVRFEMEYKMIIQQTIWKIGMQKVQPYLCTNDIETT